MFRVINLEGRHEQHAVRMEKDQMVVERYLPTAFLRALNRTPRAMVPSHPRQRTSKRHLEADRQRSLAQFARALAQRTSLGLLAETRGEEAEPPSGVQSGG